MVSDIITISNKGDQTEAALDQADKVAVYKELSKKSAIHLRLLTEEMLGLMRSITGADAGQFWIEDNEGTFELHLKVETFIDYEQREQLLSTSKSGKNEAARGIMGKIRTFFDPVDGMPVYMLPSSGMVGVDMTWSMRSYQNLLETHIEQKKEGAQEAWDELEKSVVSHVADDIKVSMVGRNVELVIYKKMA